ncbi:DUF262 domain-containing protein [Clostridium neonatale]|uniref:DUF262 domain-containing protein n=1 Tax=Clostridium neonatale TaxID=137838 RepID=UPI00291BF6E3|nr:DUF262 domain-containing protein [Clostridium neonatale]CAI3607694.1 DUF262 domain-containing protein [Clostridium neonatale]
MINEEIDVFDDEDESDLSNNNIERYEEAVIWGTDWTVETIVSQLEKENIDLNPKFQRRDAWSVVEKSRLIESLILGIPVPPIILAEKKNKKGKYIVIDGKQRLLSLRKFSSKDENFSSYKLKGLTLIPELNGKTYEELDQDIELSNFKAQLDNQTIRTIVIKNWPDENFLFTVFLRLNTGSKKLSPQELRQALHPGDFVDYLDTRSGESKVLLDLFHTSKPDSRMRDVELALRYFAFKYCIDIYNGNLKYFLDTTCKILNQEWENKSAEIEYEFTQLEAAIKFTKEVFGEKEAFSRYISGKYNNKFNRPLFEVFTYYFSIEDIRNELSNNMEEFKNGFEKICSENIQFNESLSSTTKQISRVKCRFDNVYMLLKSLLNVNVPEINLR